MELTDRALTEALFNLVAALARKLTGEMPLLCIDDDNGNVFHFVPKHTRAIWLKDGDEWRCPFHPARATEAAARPVATEPAA